jgi:hypothetical protein
MPSDGLRVYKNNAFARFAKKARITDADLWRAAQSADRGLIDADLGGGVIKQRIARQGQGKSGGSRAIILFKSGNRAVFVYGFEKKDLANIRLGELEGFRRLAKVVLNYDSLEMAEMIRKGALLNVQAPQDEL